MIEMKNFLIQINDFLENHVAPISNGLDHDEILLKKTYNELIKLEALTLLIPKELGGLGGERLEWIEYNILMSQYSGALLFLQAQHQFSVFKLKKLLPEKKIADLLQTIVQEKIGLGIALAANRQLLKVIQVKNGFELSGKLLWVTGFGYFNVILFSFDFENNVYYFILPFNSDSKNKSITISKKIETTVFNSTNTVSIELENYYISNDNILATHATQPKQIIEHPSIYNFAGATKALLETTSQGKYKNGDLAKKKYTSLITEWEIYHNNILSNQSCSLKLRAQGLSLAEKCIHYARIVCGAESILASHPINRISREIWQYSVAGYSEDQLNAYLEIN